MSQQNHTAQPDQLTTQGLNQLGQIAASDNRTPQQNWSYYKQLLRERYAPAGSDQATTEWTLKHIAIYCPITIFRGILIQVIASLPAAEQAAALSGATAEDKQTLWEDIWHSINRSAEPNAFSALSYKKRREIRDLLHQHAAGLMQNDYKAGLSLIQQALAKPPAEIKIYSGIDRFDVLDLPKGR